MTSRHVIMGHVTSTGCSVTRFMSGPQQLPFANDVTSTVCFNRVMGEHN